MEIKIILPVLIIILLIISGIFLRQRLRKVERRIVFKDKYYDEALKEYAIKRKGIVHKSIDISSITPRLFTLYGTFVGVVALFLFFFGIVQGNVLVGIIFALLSVVVSPFVLLVFPRGVDMFFDPTSQGGITGYFLYIAILWFAIFLDDQYFTYIYLIFVIILILNIIGCSNTDLSGLS